MSHLGPSFARTSHSKSPVYRGRRGQSSDSDNRSEPNTSFSSTSADEEKNKKTKSRQRKHSTNITSKSYKKQSSSKVSSDDSSDQNSSHEIMVTRSSVRNNGRKNSLRNIKSRNNSESSKKRNWSTNDDDESDNDQSDYESYSDYSSRSHSDETSDEDSEPHIQQILGVREDSLSQEEDDQKSDPTPNFDDENNKYYVKWANLSYIHCEWLTAKEIMAIPGGEAAFKKFKKKMFNDDLSPSTSIPSLLTASQDDLNLNWFHVERIIGHRIEKFYEEDENSDSRFSTQAKEPIEKNQYLVKWKSLPYEQCTWENEEDIDEKSFIDDYHARLQHWNSTVYNKKNNKTKENIKAYSYDSNSNENENDNDSENAEKETNSSSSFVKITEPLADKAGNLLRPYQLEGLNWLRYCWQNGINSILADEMGLGKTVQIVSALNDIAANHNITGPFMIIAPLTTLPQWKNEIEKWSNLNAIIYQGSPKTREIIEEYEFPAHDEKGNVIKNAVSFDALITNYETFATNFDKLNEIEWRYLVLDEGHRLKNHAGKCYQLLLNLTYEHCTLLTGTPIQNNVEELWSLLHLLHPDRFNNLSQFLEQFGNIDNAETLRNLQNLIRPFILRRKKNDVETSIAAKEETIIEVELTRIQKTYYRALLLDNTSTLLQQITGGSLPSLLNLMMQLRKVCNHPFLIKGAKENIEQQIASKLPPDTSQDEVELNSLIDSSGKMILIDKLLPKLQNDGHKVLIFSQMVKVLDIIEDYLIRKDYTFERIDGSVPEIEREAAIERFSSQEDIFIFLLCTKAGGVGINLTAADTVIIFDSDWNPQNDVQAQSRCHRIGQKKEVKVYRLVTRGTYELQMLDRASKKLGLDHALLDGGELNRSQPMAAKEIEKLLRQGAYNITHDDDTEIDNFCAADIDQILERHSTKMSSNDSGRSLFNKAKFDPENDSLDMNAADFWLQVLPSVSSVNNDETTQKRRCRKDHPSSLSMQNSSDDSDSEIHEKVSRPKKTSPVSIRGTIKKLLSTGLGDSPYQRAILHQAATFMLLLLSDEEKECIQKMLNIDDISEPSEEIKTALAEFSSNLNDVRERKSSIVRRCILFYKLESLIRKLQGDIDLWPPSDFVDPMLDYAVLLGISRNGIGDGALLVSSLESLGIIGKNDFMKLKKFREREERQEEDQNENENNEEDRNEEEEEANDENDEEAKFMLFDDYSLEQLQEGIVDDSILDELKQISLKSLEKRITNMIDTLNLQLKQMGITEPEEEIEILNPIEWKNEHPKLYNRNELNSEEYQSLFLTISQLGLPRKSEYYLLKRNPVSKIKGEKENAEENANDEPPDEIKPEDDLHLQFFKNNIYINCNEVDWKQVLFYSKLTCVSIEAIAKAGESIAAFADEDENTIFSAQIDSNKESHSSNESNENDKENDGNENENEKEKEKEKAPRRKKGERKAMISDILEKAAHIMPIISKLGTYGTRPWQRKLRNSIRDIEKVRAFVPTFVNEIDMAFLKRVKQYDAIDWWEPKHDLALINAIYEYGQLMVTTWVVDPKGPFREHINPELLEDFEKAAENEKLKGRQCKPKELGDMAFIFKDKLRMTRALLVVRFIETHRERYIEKQFSSGQSSLKVQKQAFNAENEDSKSSIIINNTSNNESNETESRLPITNNSIIRTPCNVNSNLVLLNLGVFYSKESVYPNGYIVHRKYYSTIPTIPTLQDPNNLPFNQIWYEASVSYDTSNMPIFNVKTLSQPFCLFSGTTPDAPWQRINATLEMVVNERQRNQPIGIQMPMQVPYQMVDPFQFSKKTMMSQIMDGSTLFGFNEPFIIDCFKKMKSMIHNAAPIPIPIPKIKVPLQRNQLQIPILQSNQQQQQQQNFIPQQFPTVQIQNHHPIVAPSIIMKPSEKQIPVNLGQPKQEPNIAFQKIQPPQQTFHIDYQRPMPMIEPKILLQPKNAVEENPEEKKEAIQVIRRGMENTPMIPKVTTRRIQIDQPKNQMQIKPIQQLNEILVQQNTEKQQMKLDMLLLDDKETKNVNQPSHVLIKHTNRNVKSIKLSNQDPNQNQNNQ